MCWYVSEDERAWEEEDFRQRRELARRLEAAVPNWRPR